MQWAAPGTQSNTNNPEDFGSILDTAAQRIWDVPDVLPWKDQPILLHRVQNSRRLEDFLKILLPWKALSPFSWDPVWKSISVP